MTSVTTVARVRYAALASVGLIALGWLLYSPTRGFPFVFDDHIYLVQNPLVQTARSFAYPLSFADFATISQRLGLDPDLSTNFILRPFAYLTFHLNFVADGMNPRGFRAVNVVIHCANAVLLFHVLRLLLHTSRKRDSVSPFSAGCIALGSALAFLVHPLQIESVTYIIQRFTSLATFFYLLTIATYLLANAARNPVASLAWRWLSVCALIVGMLSKEILFTAPCMLIILDWLVVGTPAKLVCRRAVPYCACLPIIPALVALTAAAQHGGRANLSEMCTIATTGLYTPYDYALTQLSVVLSYLRLILLPLGLNLDREYPLSTSLWQPRVLLSAMTIAVLLGSAWYAYRRRTGDVRYSLLLGSVLWFFVTVAVSSSVIPLPDLMAEHRAYLASIGALTALVCGADLVRTHLARDNGWRALLPAGIAVWVLALSGLTLARNDVWRSEIRIWSDTASKSPGKARPWLNLGVAYAEHDKFEQALPCFRMAIRLEPAMVAAYRNLGVVKNALGKYERALETSQAGLRYAPEYCELHFNMGVSYCGLGNFDEAIQCLEKAVSVAPSHVPSHLWLAAIHTQLQHTVRAAEQYAIVAALRPADAQIHQAISRIQSQVAQGDAGAL